MEPPTVREITRRLEREGWKLARCKKGRRIYVKDGKIVTIHGRDSDRPKKGTYAEIKREAGW